MDSAICTSPPLPCALLGWRGGGQLLGEDEGRGGIQVGALPLPVRLEAVGLELRRMCLHGGGCQAPALLDDRDPLFEDLQ